MAVNKFLNFSPFFQMREREAETESVCIPRCRDHRRTSDFVPLQESSIMFLTGCSLVIGLVCQLGEASWTLSSGELSLSPSTGIRSVCLHTQILPMGLGNWTQVSMPVWKALYRLSHFRSSLSFFWTTQLSESCALLKDKGSKLVSAFLCKRFPRKQADTCVSCPNSSYTGDPLILLVDCETHKVVKIQALEPDMGSQVLSLPHLQALPLTNDLGTLSPSTQSGDSNMGTL